METPASSTGSIMLPGGQKALCHVPGRCVLLPTTWTGDGFATRIVIGEDGKPTCEMVMDDGTVSTGSYDLVPLLEDFIQEHPDFSYTGRQGHYRVYRL